MDRLNHPYSFNKLLPVFLKDQNNIYHHIYYAFTVEHVNLCCNFILEKNIHFVTMDIEIQQSKDNQIANQWHSYVKRTEYNSISLITLHVGNISFVINMANISKNYDFVFRDCDSLIVLLNSQSICKIVFSESDELMLNQNGIFIQNTLDIQKIASMIYKIQNNWDTCALQLSLKKCCDWLKKKTGDFRLSKYNSNHSCYDNPRESDIIYASNDAYVTHQCFIYLTDLGHYEIDHTIEFFRWSKFELNKLITYVNEQNPQHCLDNSYTMSFWFGKNNSVYSKKRMEQIKYKNSV